MLVIDWNMLDNISYQTQLGKSLKNTLRRFDKEELFDELESIIEHFTELESEIKANHRIKALQSCLLKYEKYYPNTQAEKAFNDILGLRFIIDDYEIVDNLQLPEFVRVADMRNGKANDDGYRGVHLYYQKDHMHYPIEIQFMTTKDRIFNEWLHIYLYKYVKDNTIGASLRTLYETGVINSEDDFRKEMRKYVLPSG